MFRTKHRTIPLNVTVQYDATGQEVLLCVSIGEYVKKRTMSIQEYNRVKDWNPPALKDTVSNLAWNVVDEFLRNNMDILKTDTSIDLNEHIEQTSLNYGGH